MTNKDSLAHVDSRTQPDQQATGWKGAPTPHSPLPWYRGIETDIVDAGGFIIATADDDNARLIIAACNAHHDLLAALKWAEQQLRALVTEDDGSGAFIRGTGTELAGFGSGLDCLRAAIEKAEAR